MVYVLISYRIKQRDCPEFIVPDHVAHDKTSQQADNALHVVQSSAGCMTEQTTYRIITDNDIAKKP